MAPAARPRLIASDLDGTLLNGGGTISGRTLAALRRARALGIEVVLVTGRPPRYVTTIAGVRELGGVAICINGAMTYDVEREAIIEETRLAAPAARDVVERLRAHLPDVAFAVEVGLEFGCEPDYRRGRLDLGPTHLPPADALSLCARGVTKLIAAHPELAADELFGHARGLVGDRASVTQSGAPFVEISAPAVSKASALAAYCAGRAIDRAQVISFGDMPNDLPMLAWAGRSVAMANAHPTVLAAAGEVTRTNEDDGVAMVVERILDA